MHAARIEAVTTTVLHTTLGNEQWMCVSLPRQENECEQQSTKELYCLYSFKASVCTNHPQNLCLTPSWPQQVQSLLVGHKFVFRVLGVVFRVQVTSPLRHCGVWFGCSCLDGLGLRPLSIQHLKRAYAKFVNFALRLQMYQIQGSCRVSAALTLLAVPVACDAVP